MIKANNRYRVFLDDLFQSNLAHLTAFLIRKVLNSLDDFKVRADHVLNIGSFFAALTASCFRAQGAGQMAAVKRLRNQADAGSFHALLRRTTITYRHLCCRVLVGKG